VNWGNLRGEELYKTILGKLQELCPYSESRECPGSPGTSTKYQYFDTITPDSHGNPTKKYAQVHIERGDFSNNDTLQVMLELAVRTLQAFVSQDDGYNCWKGKEDDPNVYCNVPRTVRVGSHSSTIRLQVLTSVLPGQLTLPL